MLDIGGLDRWIWISITVLNTLIQTATHKIERFCFRHTNTAVSSKVRFNHILGKTTVTCLNHYLEKKQIRLGERAYFYLSNYCNNL